MPDLSLKEILLKSSEFLKNKQISNYRYETEILLSHFLEISRMDLYLQFDKIIPETQANQIRTAIIERGKRKPLQYIIGIVHFLDTELIVNDNVLIPRPETEFLVDYILKNEKEANPVLDMCTGSGAIAIALKKKWVNSLIKAIDISDKALRIAKLNAKKNLCEVDFIISDLFTELKDKNIQKFDIIISNPPYVTNQEYKNLDPELFFEPKLALVAENNGLFFYEEIIRDSIEFLADNGVLYLEIGSEQAGDIYKIANEYKYNECLIIKDLCERDRIARLKK